MATRKPKVVAPVVGDSLASMLGMDETVIVPEEELKSSKLSPFDFLNEITFGKQNLMVIDGVEAQYTPYIINKGLSQSQDCILWANYMNCRPHIPNKGQYYFLLNTITKRKRYDKWIKVEEVENLELVMGFYGFSRSKALTALKLLSEENIAYIKRKTYKGGSSGKSQI